MVARATRLWLVLLASSTLASCVIVTERPVDSAPPPAPAISDSLPEQATVPLKATAESTNQAPAAALAPAATGAVPAPESAAPPAAAAGAPGLGAAY